MRCTCLLVLLFAFQVVQAQESSSIHHHMPTKVIDGAVHPEQIPDLMAYRLYLLSLSTPSVPTETEKKRQSIRLSRLALPDAERDTFLRAITNFRAEHDRLIREYNEKATAANARGETYDISPLIQQLNNLTQSTHNALQTILSETSWARLDQIVQYEKRRMQIRTSEGEKP